MDSRSRTYAPRLWFFAVLVVYSLVARLIPWMATDYTETSWLWNFSPLYAICLFGAAFYRDVRWSFAVPLATYLIGDLAIWAVTGRRDFGLHPNIPFVYGSTALMVIVGLYLRKNRSWLAIAGTGLVGATLFFIVSNFGMWFTGDGTIYPHTTAGLQACYVKAIPYFRTTLISTLLFSGIMFSPLGVRALEASESELPDLSTTAERSRVRV